MQRRRIYVNVLRSSIVSLGLSRNLHRFVPAHVIIGLATFPLPSQMFLWAKCTSLLLNTTIPSNPPFPPSHTDHPHKNTQPAQQLLSTSTPPPFPPHPAHLPWCRSRTRTRRGLYRPGAAAVATGTSFLRAEGKGGLIARTKPPAVSHPILQPNRNVTGKGIRQGKERQASPRHTLPPALHPNPLPLTGAVSIGSEVEGIHGGREIAHSGRAYVRRAGIAGGGGEEGVLMGLEGRWRQR